MQFKGHSLLVHQSMSVSWAFTSSHFVSQIRLRDFFRLLAIGMCHFLPVHHFGMACMAGRRSKYNTFLYLKPFNCMQTNGSCYLIATLKSSRRTKESVDDNIYKYIYIYINRIWLEIDQKRLICPKKTYKPNQTFSFSNSFNSV